MRLLMVTVSPLLQPALVALSLTLALFVYHKGLVKEVELTVRLFQITCSESVPNMFKLRLGREEQSFELNLKHAKWPLIIKPT